MRASLRSYFPVVALLIAVPAVWAGTVTFNFNSDPSGKATQFTDTSGGISGTFSSSGDPGGFQVGPSFFKTLTGQVLLDPGPAGLNNLTLTVLFSTTGSSITLDFATNSSAGVPFDLSAYDGSTLVGTATVTGTIPSGFTFPEGAISFSGATFNEVVLSAPAATDFAVDNIAFTTGTSVPEPSTALLMFFGASALLTLARRRATK